MFRAFFGNSLKNSFESGAAGGWPQGRIVDSLTRQFDKVEAIGEDDGFVVFGVSDRGVNFVVALVTAGRNVVTELGFLARFVGFSVSPAQVEQVNRNLHLSVVGLEENGDLYLLAGLEAFGTFDEGAFSLILEAWRRDLMVVLHALSGGASLMAAFPVARLEAARRFAANAAPREGERRTSDLLKAYLGAPKTFCDGCGGRGKRGLIARRCPDCEGTGFTPRR